MSRKVKSTVLRSVDLIGLPPSKERAAKHEQPTEIPGEGHNSADAMAGLLVRKRVAELMLSHVKPTEIAEELNIPLKNVYKINAGIMRDWRTELQKDKSLIRSRELARLDSYERRLKEGFDQYMANGQFELAARVYDRIQRAIEFRSELHGLRMPKHGIMPMQGTNVTINTFEYEGERSANAPKVAVETISAHLSAGGGDAPADRPADPVHTV